MDTLIGRKAGMTRVFEADGKQTAVTVLEVGPCVVVQRKTKEKDGYDAVQLGFGQQKESRLKRPQAGHYRRAGVKPCRILREVRVDSEEEVKVGDAVTVGIFEGVGHVDVAGISKGRGFQGVVRRHGMRGGRASHGSMSHRRVGAIGQCEFPARVFKNKKMPGHMGAQRVTVQNLRVVQVRVEDNLMLVEGAVPGPTGGVVMVRRALKKHAGAE